MRKMCVFYRRPVHNNGNEVVFYCKLTATSLWSATFSAKMIESTDVSHVMVLGAAIKIFLYTP